MFDNVAPVCTLPCTLGTRKGKQGEDGAYVDFVLPPWPLGDNNSQSHTSHRQYRVRSTGLALSRTFCVVCGVWSKWGDVIGRGTVVAVTLPLASVLHCPGATVSLYVYGFRYENFEACKPTGTVNCL